LGLKHVQKQNAYLSLILSRKNDFTSELCLNFCYDP
jgi:hypothetical protein